MWKYIWQVVRVLLALAMIYGVAIHVTLTHLIAAALTGAVAIVWVYDWWEKKRNPP